MCVAYSWKCDDVSNVAVFVFRLLENCSVLGMQLVTLRITASGRTCSFLQLGLVLCISCYSYHNGIHWLH